MKERCTFTRRISQKLSFLTTLFVLFGFLLLTDGLRVAHASEATEGLEIDEILSSLDLSGLKEFFQSIRLPSDLSFDAIVEDTVSGRIPIDFSSFTRFFMTLLLRLARQTAPILLFCIAIVLLISLFNGAKSNFASKSVASVIQFVAVTVIGGLLCYKAFDLFQAVHSYVKTVSDLSYAIFPVLFTLLATLGATASVTAFQQTAAVFTTVICGVISYVITPICLYAIVFSIVTCMTNRFDKTKIHTFFLSIGKTALCSIFFLFLTFCGLQGLTTAVYDSIGIRLARFSLSKYVPVIGGYLSEGFHYLFAGGVLVKNVIGIAFLLLLIFSVLPILCEILVFLLALKLLSVVASSVSEDKISSMVKGIRQSVSILMAGVIGITVCAGIFSAIVLLACNGSIA